MALENVDVVYQRAADRKGGESVLKKLLGDPNNDQMLTKVPDLLLVVNPTGTGRVPQNQVDRLLDLGDWLKINGEVLSRHFSISILKKF